MPSRGVTLEMHLVVASVLRDRLNTLYRILLLASLGTPQSPPYTYAQSISNVLNRCLKEDKLGAIQPTRIY